MADDPSDAIQLAARALLMADAGVIAAFGGDEPRIWDDVPADASTGHITARFPFVVLGDGDQVLGVSTSCGDLSEVFSQVGVWSRETDFGETRAIAGAIRRRLGTPFALSGHDMVTATFESVFYRKEADGLTRRGIMTFRFQTAPWA